MMTETNNRGGPTPDSPPPYKDNGAAATYTVQGVQLNVSYFRTYPGILKIVELIFGIICIACSAPALFSGVHWFLFVASFCFIFTFIWCCIYFFCINQVVTIPWHIPEMIYTLLSTLFYFIAFIVILVETTSDNYRLVLNYYRPGYYSSYIAAGCFGCFNTIVYGIECFLHVQTFFRQRAAPTAPA